MIRIAVVIAGEHAPDNAFVVWRGYERSFEKARSFGYDGVELALGNAGDVDVFALDACLRKHSLQVCCISTGLTYARDGLYLTANDVLMRANAIDAIAGLIRLAKGRGNLVTLGRARGFVGVGQTRAQAEELLAESLYALNNVAADEGVQLAIEPINRYESNFINNLDEASAFLASLNLSNVGIMADLFHMNIEDDDIDASLYRNHTILKHVHIADSNRKAPGMGHTNLQSAVNTLVKMKYDGWISAEILADNNPDKAAYIAIEATRSMLCLSKQCHYMTN